MDSFSVLLVLVLLAAAAALVGASLHATVATRRAAFLLLPLAVLWPFVMNLAGAIVLAGIDAGPVKRELFWTLSDAAQLLLVAVALVLLFRLRDAR